MVTIRALALADRRVANPVSEQQLGNSEVNTAEWHDFTFARYLLRENRSRPNNPCGKVGVAPRLV